MDAVEVSSDRSLEVDNILLINELPTSFKLPLITELLKFEFSNEFKSNFNELVFISFEFFFVLPAGFGSIKTLVEAIEVATIEWIAC